MSLKPISPKNHRPKRVVRHTPPVIVVQKKKSSGPGGLIIGVLLLLGLGGGYFVYNNHQKNEAAIAARQHQLDENARRVAEVERQRAEAERQRHVYEDEAPDKTALGTRSEPEVSIPTPEPTSSAAAAEETPAKEEKTSALGDTSAPTAGDGVFNVEDTSAPPFDLSATGKKAKKVYDDLDKAIDKAASGKTFHDLQADLKRSFEVANPGLFADATTLPAFPAKEEKLLRLAQGVYVCLNLAAELEARNTVPDEQHVKFVNWLMKEDAKAARTFTYGLEHYNISDAASAADLLEELRAAYLVSPTTAAKKIPTILKAAAE